MSTKNECCGKCRISNAPPYALPQKYCSNCPCHKPTESWEAERIAMNIVHQLGDALYEALPPDVAHEHFVKARQNTNDIAIDFATKLIQELLHSQREELCGRLEGLKRTDDTQMSHDHVYDEALDDAIKAIKNND